MVLARDDKAYDQNQDGESQSQQRKSAYFFAQQQFLQFPNNNEVWTSGQQQIFVQRFDGQSIQQIQSRYLRNPAGGRQFSGSSNV